MIATDKTVIVTPWIVLCHVVTNIIDDGQKIYVRSVRPKIRTPATPNQRKTRTVTDTSIPKVAPANAACRVVKTISFTRGSQKRILHHQIPEAAPVLQIFAVKNFAAALNRCGDDERVIPGELIAIGKM